MNAARRVSLIEAGGIGETELDAFESPAVRAATLKIHRSIFNAIVARDADAARRRMARHVGEAGKVALAASGGARPK